MKWPLVYDMMLSLEGELTANHLAVFWKGFIAWTLVFLGGCGQGNSNPDGSIELGEYEDGANENQGELTHCSQPEQCWPVACQCNGGWLPVGPFCLDGHCPSSWEICTNPKYFSCSNPESDGGGIDTGFPDWRWDGGVGGEEGAGEGGGSCPMAPEEISCGSYCDLEIWRCNQHCDPGGICTYKENQKDMCLYGCEAAVHGANGSKLDAFYIEIAGCVLKQGQVCDEDALTSCILSAHCDQYGS